MVAYGRGFHRQFIHISDAVSALVAAFDRSRLPRRSYTVTGGSYPTIDQVADIVKSVLPSSRIELADGPDPTDDLQEQFDIGAAQRDFGYRPCISLEAGISSYAEWLRSQRATQ